MKSGSHLTPGIIIGLVLGVIAGTGLIILLGYVYSRSRRKEKKEEIELQLPKNAFTSKAESEEVAYANFLPASNTLPQGPRNHGEDPGTQYANLLQDSIFEDPSDDNEEPTYAHLSDFQTFGSHEENGVH